MPEVVEIVFTSQYLLSKLKGRIIKNMDVLSGRYTHQDLKGKDIINGTTSLTIENIDSKGKFMWMTLRTPENKAVYVMNTFGLTGEWGFTEKKNSRVRFEIENKDETKKYYLYFTDQRNFGTIAITYNYTEIDAKLSKLGPDLLKSTYTVSDIEQRINAIKDKDVTIVETLMDQTTHGIGSGIGNYLAATILYRAKLSPYRTIKSLKKEEISSLYEAIKYVLRLAYMTSKVGYMEPFGDIVDKHRNEVLSGKYPNYLSEVDIGENIFTFDVYQQKKDPYKNPVEKAKIIKGRTTYWVPAVQN